MLVRVGTRGSRLSLVQTDLVIQRLRQAHPDLTVERKIVTTKGDQDRRTPLFFLNQKGIFEREIDQAVLDGGVDFAVHSMKDIPVFEENTDLVIAGVPERGSPADVLVSSGDRILKKLGPGSIVGTSSLLRVSQLKRVRPDLKPEPIRGNVETRIQKVDGGEFDAVILAEAGLARLGMTGRIAERLSLEDFIPAPGQGIIATVARRDNQRVIDILKTIEHFPTRAEAEAERELVRVLEGGCKVPVGGIASASGDRIHLTARVLSVDGREQLQVALAGRAIDPVGLARKVGEEMLARGAKRFEEEWRKLYR